MFVSGEIPRSFLANGDKRDEGIEIYVERIWRVDHDRLGTVKCTSLHSLATGSETFHRLRLTFNPSREKKH